MRRLSIVVVSQQGGQSLCDIVGSRGHQAAVVHDLSRLPNVVHGAAADVALLEIPFDRPSGIVLREVRSSIPGVPIVVVGRDADIEHAGQAFELGAQEFVPEVGDGHALLSTVGVLLGARRIDSQLQHLRSRDSANATFDAIAGDSVAMNDLRRVLRNLVRSSGPGARPPVLLIGETGTGKGLVARTLHYQGARRSGSFVDVNCAAIPPTLIESELFGYERGAFTDAHVGRAGLFETADEGTLFLDEIASLPIELQGKLLTAVEEQQIRRIGARQNKRVDVQIIAATHRELGALVREGKFRQDLYHRLDVLSVRIPPLRERDGDAEVLATRFLGELCARHGVIRRFSNDAYAALGSHDWPGNVRELRNRIERAVLLGGQELVTARDLDVRGTGASREAIGAAEGGLEVHLPHQGVSLDEVERAVILAALRQNDHNVSATARFLKIGRQKLMYRMRRHHIEIPNGL